MFPIATFEGNAKSESWHGRGGHVFLQFAEKSFNPERALGITQNDTAFGTFSSYVALVTYRTVGR